MSMDERENIIEMILDGIQQIEHRLSHIEQIQKEILAIVSEEPPLVAQSATLVITAN